MAKSIFLLIFTLIHATVATGCVLYVMATVLNPCGPAHPSTFSVYSIYAVGSAGAIMLFPLGWLSFLVIGLISLPIPPFAIIGAGVLFNSYYWASFFWNRGARNR